MKGDEGTNRTERTEQPEKNEESEGREGEMEGEMEGKIEGKIEGKTEGKIKARTIILGIAFALVVYFILFAYVFGFSPIVTSSSQSKWLETELSKEPKFSDTSICKECHYQLYTGMKNHSSVSCEACHGPGVEHTIKRSHDTITINRTRDACLKCHLEIGGRTAIHTVNETHHPGIFCVVCHNPHK